MADHVIINIQKGDRRADRVTATQEVLLSWNGQSATPTAPPLTRHPLFSPAAPAATSASSAPPPVPQPQSNEEQVGTAAGGAGKEAKTEEEEHHAIGRAMFEKVLHLHCPSPSAALSSPVLSCV